MSHPVLTLQAPLSDDVLPWLEEVALNEQGHALFTRHAGSSLPCPAIDFDEGEPGCSPADELSVVLAAGLPFMTVSQLAVLFFSQQAGRCASLPCP